MLSTPIIIRKVHQLWNTTFLINNKINCWMINCFWVLRTKTKLPKSKSIKTCCNPEKMSDCLQAAMLNFLMVLEMKNVGVDAVGRRTRESKVLLEPVKTERIVSQAVNMEGMTTISCVWSISLSIERMRIWDPSWYILTVNTGFVKNA